MHGPTPEQLATQEALFYQQNWQPAYYKHWYEQQPIQLQPTFSAPHEYETWYMTWVNYYKSTDPPNPPKLSRNQKRKLKKQQLQQEYAKQQAEIGKWVKVERKDLVEGLKKIEEQEEKIKKKRREKLSHLIEIHKEVYKHAMKKNKSKATTGGGGQRKYNGGFRKKQKKASHIKRAKEMYTKMYGKPTDEIVGIKNELHTQKALEKKQKKGEVKMQEKEEIGPDEDEGFVTESQEQQQATDIMKKGPSEPSIKTFQRITYQRVGKLSGYNYNNIVLREWVDNVPSPELEDLTLRLVNRLSYKQAIKRINQPEKAKKIIVAGLHECKRTIWTKLDKKKSKMLIMALNIERNNLERGTDDQIQGLIDLADKERVPIIHVSTRAKLGRAFTGKFGPRITLISIVNDEGYSDMTEAVMAEWKLMREKYEGTRQGDFKF